MTPFRPLVTPLEGRTAPSATRFDFGTSVSPVAADHAQVTAATVYSAVRGYGWTAGVIYDWDRGFGSDTARDFNYTADGTFVADVANGTYTVTVTVGDLGIYHHDRQGIFFEGVQVDTVDTAAGQVTPRTYTVTVADGQLTFRLKDLGGTDPYSVVEALVFVPTVISPPPTLPTTAKIDFGTPVSPVAAGYSRATAADWSSGTIYEWDRGIGSATDRDFNYTADGTFETPMANGQYVVAVTLGDLGVYHHDAQEVYLEGRHVDTVSTFAGQVVNRSYEVTVADGRLTLRLRDGGGTDPYAVIEAMTVTPGTLPPPPPPPPVGAFSITVRSSGMTASQQAIFQQAADRWAQVIVGDLPDMTYGGEAVDDLLIDASSAYIDGVGGVLGSASPYAFRPTSQLPYYGVMEFDSADMASLEANGRLFSVALHEMAHVLGFGILWPYNGLMTGYGGPNPLFVGPRATAEYNARFGTNASGVPVEAGGGAGTAYGHWSEAVFGNELMTGWLSPGAAPLSRITVAALGDMGYVVNPNAADPF